MEVKRDEMGAPGGDEEGGDEATGGMEWDGRRRQEEGKRVSRNGVTSHVSSLVDDYRLHAKRLCVYRDDIPAKARHLP